MSIGDTDSKRRFRSPEPAFSPNTEVLQYEPDSHVTVWILEPSSAGHQTADEVARIHPIRLLTCERVVSALTHILGVAATIARLCWYLGDTLRYLRPELVVAESRGLIAIASIMTLRELVNMHSTLRRCSVEFAYLAEDSRALAVGRTYHEVVADHRKSAPGNACGLHTAVMDTVIRFRPLGKMRCWCSRWTD